jgi:hypothetical protein
MRSMLTWAKHLDCGRIPRLLLRAGTVWSRREHTIDDRMELDRARGMLRDPAGLSIEVRAAIMISPSFTAASSPPNIPPPFPTCHQGEVREGRGARTVLRGQDGRPVGVDGRDVLRRDAC